MRDPCGEARRGRGQAAVDGRSGLGRRDLCGRGQATVRPVARPAARVVVLDPADHLLLQRFLTPEGWEGWITPGGGVERGESVADAALRELIEEVGVRDVSLVGPIWVRYHEFTWKGDLVAQQETFFLARLHERVEAAGEHGVALLEAEGILEQRWWSLDDLEAASVETAPRSLVDLVRALIADGPPAEPIDAGV